MEKVEVDSPFRSIHVDQIARIKAHGQKIWEKTTPFPDETAKDMKDEVLAFLATIQEVETR
jgi:hypothetical protein